MLDLLKGVRVIDLTSVVLGPYATQLIADLGADVVKVEPDGGDIFRGPRPGREGGDGAGFLNLNRNKRSIQLNIKDPDDKAILRDLTANADVFVHNIRAKSAEKLGIDFETVTGWNPEIVYAWARGYGDGPYADEPAYDDCIQAASGFAWLNENENGEPKFAKTVLCDKVAGLHLALGIAAALASRARNGGPCQIEVPMFEAMASFLLPEHLSGQTFVPPLPDRGYARLEAPGRKPYRTQDGYLTIMPYNARHWRAFLELVGEDELAKAAWLSRPDERSNRISELYQTVEDHAGLKTTQQWLSLLREKDIPCAPVNRIEDLPTEPHLIANGFFKHYDHPAEGRLQYVGSPFSSRTANRLDDTPPPVLDGDRKSVLKGASETF